MTALSQAVDRLLEAHRSSDKPLAIILAGHNGAGKSTMWRHHLSNKLQIPLINADRMMLSILPEHDQKGFLPSWAAALRDTDESWMRVAQKGVEAFVAQAMGQKVPFAVETVFSYWVEEPDGTVRSKIDLIADLQRAGYFVLLCFVGLSSVQLSAARVMTRVATGGHSVAYEKLVDRFPRTQRAIGAARSVADATIMVDNSLDEKHAFAVARIQLAQEEIFDVRDQVMEPAIAEWLEVVVPRSAAADV